MTLLLVMAGAGAGAAGRWWTDRFVQTRHDSVFPWGTFIINVLGSLLLGVLLGSHVPGQIVLLLGTGFCGGFTTFSTFSYETYRLTEDAAYRIGGMNVAASVTVGLLASFAGWWLADAILG